MALADDAATVLDQFSHDVANLPPEISHLFEEMQARNSDITSYRGAINKRDGELQKFIKLNGSLVKNPKEEMYSKTILTNYERALQIQNENVDLTMKAAALLDKHVKRLDMKIRELQNEGQMPLDPNIPSLLRPSPANLVDPASSVGTGANTPLHPLSINTAGGSTGIANAAIARITNAAAVRSNSSPAIAGMQPHPLLNQPHLANATPAAAAAAQMSQRQREMSVSSDTKRRRLNASLGNLPAAPSNLARHSSVGPGTPKAGTPGSRAGSAGPRPMKKASKKPAPILQMRKKLSKKSARRLLGAHKASPSTTGDDESALSGSDDENASVAGEGEDEGMEDDNTKYCFCGGVSYGEMVGCDNPECVREWFHYECVGLTAEPEGDWVCSECIAKGYKVKAQKKKSRG